ncbi:hypothetical protein M942_00105 [Enterobacter ludwigii]|uniref:DUF2913 family protein n=1 Tax=Enterobacter ludwigii TaxID=299767 RepID=UPI0003D82ABD|nr:DUF2913 family protein [Enterobacter ludwigii]AHE72389.1 hypothetical protein M942_00105 [Enterobacter ludwigii]KLP38047.1 hypothetical protein ABR36_13255 [Enterobacter ludwigii]
MTVTLHKRPTEDLAHLAWCILAAVGLARQEGKALSGLQTHMFIMQWLLTAQKRKLFPRTLAPDIIWLQEQGKRYGPSARLYSKVEYIWLSSSGELTQQSTLFRFTYMIDTLRTMGWKDMLLSAKEWAEGGTPAGNVCAIYTPKDELHTSFTEKGELIKPMELRLTGDISGIPALLAQCNLNAERLPDDDDYFVYQLLTEQKKNITKKDARP